MKHMLFTPLVQYDANWSRSPTWPSRGSWTRTGVTLRLRNDVRWHDGQPVTAEDVVFTFDLAKNPETASLLESAYLTMVAPPRWWIRTPCASTSWRRTRSRWTPSGGRRCRATCSAGSRPGAGAGTRSTASRWAAAPSASLLERRAAVVLEANDEFPQALGGRPHLDRIVFRVIPESTTRLTELLTGAIDVNYTVLPDEARRCEQQRGVTLHHYPSREFPTSAGTTSASPSATRACGAR
jgi:peptide/nickel transport system substrate-binding protein